jgi:hypothetical protein
VLAGFTLGLAVDVSSSVMLEAGLLRQWGHWPEPGNFRPRESVDTHLGATSLAFGLTYTFREKTVTDPWT